MGGMLGRLDTQEKTRANEASEEEKTRKKNMEKRIATCYVFGEQGPTQVKRSFEI